ncbi:MAG TPA: 3-oxoacyl-[acyl-carrier-protein] synthase III C-terminal domain-containing protein [bacterium]|jgi:3-oxoacyl-[acyl-carrier-protein] synthase-3|nr:3-oxoacyl-[acyl-carrier-protein] synthase III C-terminal domain-containing protein [bacterium]
MHEPVAVIGTGAYLPGQPVPPERVEDVLGRIADLPARIESRAVRMGTEILQRAGVKHRYYALDPLTRTQTETNASMAEKAIRAALEPTGDGAGTIDLLICAGAMADYFCPPTSALVQDRLGIARCTEIEIHSNCSGAPKGLQVALDMLRGGRYRRAAVVYAQLSSVFLRGEFFNPQKVRLENLVLRWMLSDGAGAVILDRREGGLQLLDVFVESRGGGRPAAMVGGLSGAMGTEITFNGNGMYPALFESGQHHVWQDIGEVNRRAPRHLLDGLKEMLEGSGVPGSAVDHFLLGIPGRHFMTDAMRDYFVNDVGGDPARVPYDIEDFGYCGGATMFIQFDRLVRSGRVRPGDLIAAYLEESSKWMSGGFLARQT